MKRVKGFMAGLTAALLIAIGLSSVTATQAMADFNGPKRGPGVTLNNSVANKIFRNVTVAGSFIMPDGHLAWCVDPLRLGPIGRVFNDPQTVTAWTNGQGIALSQVELAQLSYVMATYGSFPASAYTDKEAAAIFFAVRHLAGYTSIGLMNGYSSGPNSVGSYQLTDENSFASRLASHAGVRDRALEMVNDAIANYSLWDGTYTREILSDPVLKDGDMFRVSWTMPGIRAGKDVIVTLTHPDGSTTQHVITTGSDDKALFEYVIPAGVSGAYSVSAEMSAAVTSLARATHPVMAFPKSKSVQVLIVGTGNVTPWRDGGGARALVNVAVSTTISETSSQPGSTVSDSVMIHGLSATGYTYELAGYIAHLPAGATDWSTATTVHTFAPTVSNGDITGGTWSASGLGTWTLPEGAEGQYSFGYQLTATPDAAGEAPAIVVHELGLPTQTTQVVTPVYVTTGGSLDTSNVWFWALALGVAGLALTGGVVARNHRGESVTQ